VTSSLTLNNVQAGSAGTYAVVVSNDLGWAASSGATLTVNPSAPVITRQPVSQSAAVNGSATFLVGARGSSLLRYQWQNGGSPIAGATATALALSNLQATNAGAYAVVVANDLGSVTSSVVRLEVNSTAVIEYWPVSPGYATPFGLSNITALAIGSRHTVALRQDGTVVSWGYSDYGVTNVPPGLSNVVAIAAGQTNTVALKSDGTVVAWGDNTYGQSFVPPGLSNVVAIAAGGNDAFALRSDGTLIGWGDDSKGQLDMPPGLTNVQVVAAGLYNGFAVTADGALAQWGNGPVWQLNSGTSTQLVVAAGMSNVVGVAAAGWSAWTLHDDTTVLPWGWDGYASLGMSNVAAIAAGGSSPNQEFLFALKQDGTVDAADAGSPVKHWTVPPAPPSNTVAVAAGPSHAAVLANDGTPCAVGPAWHRTAIAGSTVFLPPGIVGQPPMSYQWQFNGTNLPGATNLFLTLTNVPLSAAGTYRCIAANSLGTATNQTATLVVLRSTPRFGVPQVLSNGGFSLRLDQLSGHGAVVIFASSNLVDWAPVFSNPPVTGSLQFADPEGRSAPTRFYRALEN
jgi:hypothetical protein